MSLDIREVSETRIPPAAGSGFGRSSKSESSWLGKRQLLALAALFAAVFIVYMAWWSKAPVFTLDTPSYMRLAADLRNFQISQLHQRTLGYPLLMVLAGATSSLPRLLFYLSLGLQLLTAVGMSYALLLIKIPRPFIICFLVIAVLPPFVEPSAYAETETLCSFSLMVTYVSLLKWLLDKKASMLWLCAISCMFTAFVRPTFEALSVTLAAALLVSVVAGYVPLRFGLRSVAKFAIPVIALSAAALVGYSFLNYSHFKYFGLSSMSPIARSHKVANYLEFLPADSGQFRAILVAHRDRLLVQPYSDHTGYDYFYRAKPDLLKYFHGDEVAMLTAVGNASTALIKSKPMSYLQDSLRDIGSYWMPNDYPLSTNGSGFLRLTWAAFQLGLIGLFLIQCVVVVGTGILLFSIRLQRHRADDSRSHSFLPAAYTFSLAIIVYTMLVSCFAGIGDARYRVPTDLFILLNVIVGLTLWKRMAGRLKSVHLPSTNNSSPGQSVAPLIRAG